MKIRPEHYEYLKRAILSYSMAPTLAQYKAHGLSEKRWRWDLTFAVPGLSAWICSTLYPYMDNRHVDTALRAITADPTLFAPSEGE